MRELKKEFQNIDDAFEKFGVKRIEPIEEDRNIYNHRSVFTSILIVTLIIIITMCSSCGNRDNEPLAVKNISFFVHIENKDSFKSVVHYNGQSDVVDSHGFGTSVEIKSNETLSIWIESFDHNTEYIIVFNREGKEVDRKTVQDGELINVGFNDYQ